MTFLSPSWRSLNPLKGSLNHPKKVTLNHQVPSFSVMFFTPNKVLRRLFRADKVDFHALRIRGIYRQKPHHYHHWSGLSSHWSLRQKPHICCIPKSHVLLGIRFLPGATNPSTPPHSSPTFPPVCFNPLGFPPRSCGEQHQDPLGVVGHVKQSWIFRTQKTGTLGLQRVGGKVFFQKKPGDLTQPLLGGSFHLVSG